MASSSHVSDFTEMDNAKISSHHWKIMLISGMGFFTDAYDLFIIGVVMSLVKPIWHIGKVEESLVDSTALLAAAFGALLFGRVADMLGRKTDLWGRGAGTGGRGHWLRLRSQYLVADWIALHSRH